MPELPHSTYVSLTTFRRTGEPVPTPVWAAPDGDDLVVWTRADSGKVRRLRHTARVTVAPCDIRGRVHGPAVEATAGLVDRAEWPRALAALRRAYGLRFRLGYVTSRLWTRLTRPGAERHELIRIRPA
ncbi:PPOX class probable F420-dependent enzyme [Geodermatophilus bullaregiensis]|uniref:PPOX class F420-dependent oxidoreductase n=1 Tax=Geodermatophilus bullaregiensis TaxID=1564160 RepID=UPI0019599B31|nr:PPOX class F420-dependent oxidoreductase [Geodermatophilus bullaregiensis]MBM7804881.1 PPOX class probable F420-dependent enzyme [Geodermatophilus bullaregiensis]